MDGTGSLFVHVTCLKRTAPSEPSLKQDGFVCGSTILPLPSSLLPTALQPQALRTGTPPTPTILTARPGPAAHKVQELPQCNLTFTGAKDSLLFYQESGISWGLPRAGGEGEGWGGGQLTGGSM